ncbi:hypothetical protein [Deinococcus soli (ex Cha et al. 2016)]|uniref:hypothetical protein n=1 Tax=Deinococcus soli (ex Cha et al. 2016) TaxID=1309411 RepID=UPI0016658835|nr:hypothetical protein [Deinococcus soli (ex Cha et al. 2016)]GGB80532.1 hypothetical protein GCM10008019_40970 [Deinococcus soli (ex Cha et al. 2016)]
MKKEQWLSKPDGNIIETLTDPRVLATAAGAAVGAVIEKQLWTGMRDTFGIASLQGGQLKFYAPDADGKAGAEAPQLGTNRQLARLGLVVGSVAGIEYVPNGNAQYAFLGIAAVAVAHILQDLFPAIR